MHTSENLDERDLSILEQLKKNSRLSEKKIAKKTGIPMATVHNRIKKMVQYGIIESYTLKLNYAKLGKPLVAFVMLKAVNQADQRKIFHDVIKMPGIYEASIISGEFDIMFKARASSIDGFNKLIVQGIRRHKHIGESRTMICFEHFERN